MYYAFKIANNIGFISEEMVDMYPQNVLKDAIMITKEQYEDYFEKQAIGKQNGFDIVDGELVYTEPPEPTKEQVKKQKIAALDAQYHPKFEQLKEAKTAAEMLDNPTDTIKAQYAALFKEYCDKKAVVKNG